MSARRVTAVTAIPVARGCERLRPVPEILGDTAQTIKQVGNGNRKPFLDLLPHEIVLGVHRRRDALVKNSGFDAGPGAQASGPAVRINRRVLRSA